MEGTEARKMPGQHVRRGKEKASGGRRPRMAEEMNDV